MTINKEQLKEKLEKAETPLNQRGLGFDSTLNEADRINGYTQEEVEYTPFNLYQHHGMCGGCAFFLREKDPTQASACWIVDGAISHLGSCQLYINGTYEAELRAGAIAIRMDFLSKEEEGEVEEKSTEVNEMFTIKFASTDKKRQIVYGIVLEPDEVDSQDDTVSAEEIELAAHRYALTPRVVGDSHTKEAKAKPVESYIAPYDMEIEGAKVKKGSWVMAVKVFDSDLWMGVEDGSYTGFSIGALAKRIPVE